MVDNDRIKSESELNEIKLKDLDRVKQVTEKQCRIERQISDFWKDVCVNLCSSMINSQGSIMSFVLKDTSDLNERDIVRVSSKILIEGVMDQTELMYISFMENEIEFSVQANSTKIVRRVPIDRITDIHYYRDVSIMK